MEVSGIHFGRKFEWRSKIGEGSFGEIFHIRNINSGEDLAGKVEEMPQKDSAHSQLRREAKIYHMLNGSVGIPRIKWFGDVEEKYMLVMDLLGRSLEDLFNYCGRIFSLKTVLVLAVELISRIETVHKQGFLIHRDIKPENFLVGRGRDRHTIYLIDFGLAKHYANPKTKRHIPCKEGHSLTGTARYASINAQNGLEQSRRDDLFSIGYVLLYFLRGSLPWQGLRPSHLFSPAAIHTTTGDIDGGNDYIRAGKGRGGGKSSIRNRDKSKLLKMNEKDNSVKEKYRLILEKKMSLPVVDLCVDLPEEFRYFFDHLYSLSFEDEPDYAYLKGLFEKLFVRLEYRYDAHILFDWEILAYQEQQEQQEQQQEQQKQQQQP
mmetsp:Transcript_12490/g.20906  ORF Transcript_12490/g.20906 Transcript_12490/m.20906 type:complete len:376 (+) Transcript_12490:72-1199(+)